MKATKKEFLPQSLWQTVISCLPKDNNPRDDLKKLETVSLKSALYKIVTSAITTRPKKFFMT